KRILHHDNTLSFFFSLVWAKTYLYISLLTLSLAWIQNKFVYLRITLYSYLFHILIPANAHNPDRKTQTSTYHLSAVFYTLIHLSQQYWEHFHSHALLWKLTL